MPWNIPAWLRVADEANSRGQLRSSRFLVSKVFPAFRVRAFSLHEADPGLVGVWLPQMPTVVVPSQSRARKENKNIT